MADYAQPPAQDTAPQSSVERHFEGCSEQFKRLVYQIEHLESALASVLDEPLGPIPSPDNVPESNLPSLPSRLRYLERDIRDHADHLSALIGRLHL
jgi:hypothetical protein